jgi:hypothetical protein
VTKTLLVGDPQKFAIESTIFAAYRRRSLRAKGYFVIHLASRLYGVRSEQATLLACSYDQVLKRLQKRGSHRSSIELGCSASQIAACVESAIYGSASEHLKPDCLALRDETYRNELMLAPDGDQAFDDGSRILQFDRDEQVRLVGFVGLGGAVAENTLSEVLMPSREFYEVLREWTERFAGEWESAEKCEEDSQ